MDRKRFSKIRKRLGKSQAQMADLLCVSPKTVQSIEQGFRLVPVYIERQMLLLLALKNMPSDPMVKPCWETKKCPQEWRKNCIVWELQARHFCWLLNGTYCQGMKQKNWEKKIEICEECEVYKSIT